MKVESIAEGRTQSPTKMLIGLKIAYYQFGVFVERKSSLITSMHELLNRDLLSASV